MKNLSAPPPAVLFFAVLARNIDIYQKTITQLSEIFGPHSLELQPRNFEHTQYYKPEMGPELIKGFIFFPPPYPQSNLAESKLIARAIEWQTGDIKNGQLSRRINLDPGLVTLEKVILSTSKNFSHRIYIGNGIYGEVTLIYHPDKWELLPWTYPDYKIHDVQQFLRTARNALQTYLKNI